MRHIRRGGICRTIYGIGIKVHRRIIVPRTLRSKISTSTIELRQTSIIWIIKSWIPITIFIGIKYIPWLNIIIIVPSQNPVIINIHIRNIWLITPGIILRNIIEFIVPKIVRGRAPRSIKECITQTPINRIVSQIIVISIIYQYSISIRILHYVPYNPVMVCITTHLYTSLTPTNIIIRYGEIHIIPRNYASSIVLIIPNSVVRNYIIRTLSIYHINKIICFPTHPIHSDIKISWCRGPSIYPIPIPKIIISQGYVIHIGVCILRARQYHTINSCIACSINHIWINRNVRNTIHRKRIPTTNRTTHSYPIVIYRRIQTRASKR